MSNQKSIFALLEEYGLGALADKAIPDNVLSKLAGRLVNNRVSGTTHIPTKHWGSKNKGQKTPKVRRKMAQASRRINRRK